MAIVHRIKQTTMLGLCLAGHFLILLQIRESGTNLPHTCENGGTPYQHGSAFECLCPDNTTGKRCENMKCSLFECYNNGTAVKRDDYCECICPLQFIGILCENERLPSKWPDGPYALLMPTSGCPESTNHGWGTGFIHFTTKHKMEMRRVVNYSNGDDETLRLSENTSSLAGPFKNFSFRLNFCFKHANSWVGKDTMWPELNITVFGDSNGCPPGFDEEINKLLLPQLDSYWYDGYLPYFEIRNGDNESLLTTKHCHLSESVFSKTGHVQHRNPFIVIKTSMHCNPSAKNGFDVEEETLHFESLLGNNIEEKLQTNLNFCVYKPDPFDDKQTNLYPSRWPNGPYALPMLNTGCPEPLDHGWEIGFIESYGGFYFDPYLDNCNEVRTLVMQKKRFFCYKYGQQDHKNEIQWPDGNYRIHVTVKDDCPKGFRRRRFKHLIIGQLIRTGETYKHDSIDLLAILSSYIDRKPQYTRRSNGYHTFKIISSTNVPWKQASHYFPKGTVQADFSITLKFRLTSDQGEFFSIPRPYGSKHQLGLDLVYESLSDRHALRLFYTPKYRIRNKYEGLTKFYLDGVKNKWTKLGVKVKGNMAILYKNCEKVVSRSIKNRIPFTLKPDSRISIFGNEFTGDVMEMKIHKDPEMADAEECRFEFNSCGTIGIGDEDLDNDAGSGEEFNGSEDLGHEAGSGEEFDGSGRIGIEDEDLSHDESSGDEFDGSGGIGIEDEDLGHDAGSEDEPAMEQKGERGSQKMNDEKGYMDTTGPNGSLCPPPDLTQVLKAAECFGYEFKCGSGECVKKMQLCDNIKDCQDGSDEHYDNCNQRCVWGAFPCRLNNRNICIMQNRICDGRKHCDESIDEFGSVCNLACLPSELDVGIRGGKKASCKSVGDTKNHHTAFELEQFCRQRYRCTRIKKLCDELLPQKGLNNAFYHHWIPTKNSSTSCQKAVGLMDGSITDASLFASSSEEEHQPQMLRPGKNSWCPLKTDTIPYIEITLNYTTVIGGIIIYNRLKIGGRVVDKLYIPEISPIGCREFSIQYALFQNKFKKYLNQKFEIDESKNIIEPQKFIFLQPFLARHVRIYPRKTILNGSMCLRMELLGCPQSGIDYPRISLKKLEEVHLPLSLPYELTNTIFPSDKIYMWNINVPDGGYIKLSFLTINLYNQSADHSEICPYDMITFDVLFDPISAKHNDLTPIFPTDIKTLRMTFVSCAREEKGHSSFEVRLNKQTVPTIWGIIKDSNIIEGNLITSSFLGLFVNSQRIQEWVLKSDVHGMPLVLTFKSFNIRCHTGYDMYIKSENFKDENLCNTGRRPRKLYKAWTLQIRFKHGKIISRRDPDGFSATFRIEPVLEIETWFHKNECNKPPEDTGQLREYTVYSKTGKKHYRFSYRATYDDWVSQAKYCKRLNYRLVVIHDRTELEFLQSWLFYRMKELYTSKKGRLNSFILSTAWNPHNLFYVHIGLIRYSGIDGLNDIWNDGTSLSFSAWKTGEPRNISSHKCTGMHVNMTTGEGHWVTVTCKEDPVMKQDIMFASICEQPTSTNKSENHDNYSTFEQNASISTKQNAVWLFRCNSEEWVSNYAKCDGIPDCYDGSDENNCRLNNICPEDMFQCNNGVCITVGQVCDHIYDCADKTDEYCDPPEASKWICKPTSFQCGDGICINKTMVCDNIRNCADGSDETNCYTTYNTCFDYWKAGYDKHVFFDRNDMYVECQFNAIEGHLLITACVDMNNKWKDIGYQDERIKIDVADFSLFGDKCWLKITSSCPEYYTQNDCVPETLNISLSNNKFSGKQGHAFALLGDEYVIIVRRRRWKTHIKVHPAECESGPFDIGHYINCGDGSGMVSSSRKCLYDINSAGIIDGCLNFKHLDDCERFNCSMGYFKCPSSFCLAKRFVCDGERQCPAGEDETNCWCDDRSVITAIIYNEEINKDIVPFIHKFARQLYSKQIELYSVRYLFDASEHAFLIRKSLVYPYSEDLHLGEVENFTVFTPTQTLYEEISNIFNNSEGINIINIEQYDYRPLKGDFQNNSSIKRVYHIILDPRLPKRASVTTKERETILEMSEWKILASVGSVLLPTVCQAKTITTCKNHFRCMSSKVCIPVDQICDGMPQCPFGDDEKNCDFQCHANCSCELYIVNCQSRNFTQQDFKYINSTMRVLNLSENEIFENGTLVIPRNFPFLIKLVAKQCGIESVERETFFNAENIRHLDLSFNKLEVITSIMFAGLKHLTVLDLTGNIYIQSIQPKAFKMFSSLSVLSLTNTKLNEIQTDTFWGLNVNILNISHNNIRKMHSRSFNGLSAIEIDFHGNDIETFDSDIFTGIDPVQLKTIRSPAYRFCCVKPDSLPDESCWPHQDEFSSCEDLMRNSILQSLAWVVGVAAVVANGCTIFYRLYYDRKSIKRGFSMFVTNLAMSDFLMGVYMIIIAVADITFRKRYMLMDDFWRNSFWCKFAGVLATVSSEASVLFMCLITMDRILAIKYPFGQWKFSSKSSKGAMVVSWALSLVIALVPVSIPDYFKGRFYSTSGVCLALPLTHRRPPGWLYSFLIYVALNFVAFVLIAIGQLVIYLEIRKSSKRMRKVRSQRRNDIRIAKNLLLVLSTDFLCWFPIGSMAIMAANGYVIPGETYAWTAVLVLPVNAALNPFLYTLSAVLQKRADQTASRQEIVTKDSKVQCNIDVDTTAVPDVPQIARHTPLNEIRPGQKIFEPLDVLSMYIATARNISTLHRCNQIYGGFNTEDILCSNEGKKIRMTSPNPQGSGSTGDKQKDVYEFGRVLEHLLKLTKSKDKLVSAETK